MYDARLCAVWLRHVSAFQLAKLRRITPTSRRALADHWARMSRERIDPHPPNVLFGDIVKGLPVPEQSVTGLFSSHVLEHIDRQSMPVALANSFKLLASGGRFRLIMPDLVPLARHFLTQVDHGETWASDTFMRYCCLGNETPVRGASGIARAIFGNSQHRWMYDPAQVRLMLEQAGFTEIRTCQFGDSEDPRFAEVEDRDRYGELGLEALAFEARRFD